MTACRPGDVVAVTLAARVDGYRITRPGVAVRCVCQRYQTPGRDFAWEALQVFNADHGTQTGATR